MKQSCRRWGKRMWKIDRDSCVLDLIISILLVGTILKGSLITFIQKILFNFARSPYKTPESTEMWYYFQCYYTILYYTYQEEKVHLPIQKERFFEDETFRWPEEDHDPAGGVVCSPGHRCIPRDFEGNLGLCHSSASHDYLPFKNYFVMVE